MMIGGAVAWFLGVDAERKSLEDIAEPLSVVGRSDGAPPPRTGGHQPQRAPKSTPPDPPVGSKPERRPDHDGDNAPALAPHLIPKKTEKASPSAVRRHVLVAAVITALGGLLFGYDTGVVSGALLFLKKDFGGLSLVPAGAGDQPAAGRRRGRGARGRPGGRPDRPPPSRSSSPRSSFIVGVVLAAFAPAFWMLIVARFVIGLGVGSSSMVVPLYIGEMAPPRMRGALVSFNQLAITIGILVSYLADYGLAQTANWRLMFGLAAIPAVPAARRHHCPRRRARTGWSARAARTRPARCWRRVRDEGDIDDEIEEVRERRPPSEAQLARELLAEACARR